jgi:hypothetical protein
VPLAIRFLGRDRAYRHRRRSKRPLIFWLLVIVTLIVAGVAALGRFG